MWPGCRPGEAQTNVRKRAHGLPAYLISREPCCEARPDIWRNLPVHEGPGESPDSIFPVFSIFNAFVVCYSTVLEQ
jgi:hypothetical protein